MDKDSGFKHEYAEYLRDRLDNGEDVEKIAKEEDVDIYMIENLRRIPKTPYVILGHGHDICLPSGKLDIIKVPKNCVYVTFTQCGLSNFIDTDFMNKLFDKDNIIFLKDPVKYQKKLESLFGKNIHIHHPEAASEDSRTYVNNHYTLNGDFSKNNICLYSLSGVIQLPLPSKIDSLYEQTDCDFSKIDKFYRYSIYPTQTEVQELAKADIQNIHNSIIYKKNITQKQLFDKFPGIYYNVLCRLSSPHCSESISRRRSKSVSATGFDPIKDTRDNKELIQNIRKLAYSCLLENNCDKMNLDNLKTRIKTFSPDELKSLYDSIIRLKNNQSIDSVAVMKLSERFKQTFGSSRSKTHKNRKRNKLTRRR